jgi:hypothetical protein
MELTSDFSPGSGILKLSTSSANAGRLTRNASDEVPRKARREASTPEFEVNALAIVRHRARMARTLEIIVLRYLRYL